MPPIRRRRTRLAFERRIHAAALRALDLTAADRRAVVESMFHRRRRDAVSYWLQLLLSMGIATVGLVLGSTAVVIGAMLIAPLMGPIVELGMGLVVGSPVLTLRSFGRMTASVLAVVGGAALLTMLLPFQEVTAEVASRTSPTALDLLLAVFVAVAAAYTTARPGSDTTSAAAGTAIGIALVPPVCVIGFGLGVRNLEIASGATLLFLTNLTAILVVSVLFFWVLGFERVDETGWEAASLAESPPGGALRRAERALRAAFGSRHGRVIRVGLPVALAAALFLPLSRALEQVAWEVRTRGAVSRIVAEALDSRRAVQSQVSVSPGAIATQLFLVGSVEDAAALEGELSTRIAAATGVVPSVRVVAVPDADAMRQAAGSSEPGPSAEVDLAALRQRIGASLADSWPSDLGPLLGWRLEVPDSARPWVQIDYLGEPLGEGGARLLEHSLSLRLGVTLAVRAQAHRGDAATATPAQGAGWLPDFLEMAAAARTVDRLHVCVTMPRPELRSAAGGAPAVADQVRATLAAQPPVRMQVDSTGSGWMARLSAGACPLPDGGAAARGDSTTAE